MCSADDFPPYETPVPQRPRTYRLSGNAPEPRPSIALAVIGQMLEEEEAAIAKYPRDYDHWKRLIVLTEVRDAVAKAEAAS